MPQVLSQLEAIRLMASSSDIRNTVDTTRWTKAVILCRNDANAHALAIPNPDAGAQTLYVNNVLGIVILPLSVNSACTSPGNTYHIMYAY